MTASSSGALFSGVVPFILIIVIFYFFLIRPQNKKQKEIANFRKNLEVGQSVITAGGIYGKVTELEDNAVIVEIAPSVKIKVDRNSIYADAQAQVNK